MKNSCLSNVVLMTLVFSQSACGSDKAHPAANSEATGGTPAVPLDTGGATSDAVTTNLGGATAEVGGASSSQAGANAVSGGTANTSTNIGGTTSLGGATGTGGVPTTGGFSASPGLPSQCSPNAKPGQSQALVGISVEADSQFGAITPDELTLVWTLPSTTGVTISVADRAAVSSNWGVPQNIPDVPAADGQVAITPDGLTLAYVDSSTRKTFATMSRPDRSSAFEFNGATSGLDFVVQNGGSLLGIDDAYAYPVYGPHLTSFYYAIKQATGGFTWYVAGRFEQQGMFSDGTPLAFSHPPDAALVLHGVAWDENTLFFADTSTGETSWTFYDEPTVRFGPFSTIGSFGLVQPNASCKRLYGGPAGAINLTPLQ